MKNMTVKDAVEETSVEEDNERRKPRINERIGEREQPEQVIEQEQGIGSKESARRKKAHFRGRNSTFSSSSKY